MQKTEYLEGLFINYVKLLLNEKGEKLKSYENIKQNFLWRRESLFNVIYEHPSIFFCFTFLTSIKYQHFPRSQIFHSNGKHDPVFVPFSGKNQSICYQSFEIYFSLIFRWNNLTLHTTPEEIFFKPHWLRDSANNSFCLNYPVMLERICG